VKSEVSFRFQQLSSPPVGGFRLSNERESNMSPEGDGKRDGGLQGKRRSDLRGSYAKLMGIKYPRVLLIEIRQQKLRGENPDN